MSGTASHSPDFVPLRVKMMLLLAAGVLLFGAVNLVVVGRLAYSSLERRQERHLAFVARLLAGRVQQPLLQDDRVELDRLVHESVALDPELAYVLVEAPGGSLVAHSFGRRVPLWIMAAEARGRRPASIVLVGPDGRRVRDYAAPVLEGALGRVRVGFDVSALRSEVVRLVSAVSGMVLALLVTGLAAARWVARQVTRPLESITGAMDGFRLDGPPLGVRVRTGDEMEVVARQLEGVTGRLQQLYRKEQEQRREMERVERLAALGTLTAGLAHELNNPLAGVKQAARRLTDRPEDRDRVRRYAEVVLQAVGRMERLLGEMLGFARTAEAKLSEVSPCEVLQSAAGLARPHLAQAGAMLEVQCATPRAKVLVDPDLLAQVLLNLLINAADALKETADGRVRVRCEEGGGGFLRLAVEDNGPGVPPELRERIFDPFFTTKAPGDGTGLGLSTAFTAVREMGGRLRLEESEVGARFVIELPRAEEEAPGG